MARTVQLDLPLLAPSQAQKHVTMNEALVRLDAAARPRVIASDLSNPPAAAADGESYLVPVAAGGAWAGRTGQIAVRSNGGWIYFSPASGWRIWDEADFCERAFDGVDWAPHAVAMSPGGAATISRVIEFEHAIDPGAINATSVSIPSNASVIGVTGRVIDPIHGPGLTGWRAGVVGSDNRYGSGIGLASGSFLAGLTGSPVTYYSNTPLLLSAEGGAFAGGFVRLAIHVVQLSPPRI